LVELVGIAYSAANEPARWREFLESLATATTSTMAGLLVVDTTSPDNRVSIACGIDPVVQRRYDEYYFRINPVLGRARSRGLMSPGTIRLSHELIEESELRKTEFYADFLHVEELDYGLGCTLLGERTSASSLTLQRSPRFGPYGEAETELVAALIPHLRRVLEINERLTRERALGLAASQALDGAEVGLFVLDGRGRVVEHNRAGGRLAAAGDGLSLDRGGLRGSTPSATRAIDLLVRGCQALARGEGLPPARPVLLPRPSGRRALQLLAMPTLSRGVLLTPGSAAVVVFVIDPEAYGAIDAELLTSLGLTPAEARLARRLAAGESVREAAQALGVSYETARSQLKQVFAKTGTRRQGELVALFGRLSLLGRRSGD
jgi:DNA-binding CsgD family transcriptional regulator